MSINTNTILGEIASGTDCFLVGRHTQGADVIYTVFVTDPTGNQGWLSVGNVLPVSFGATGGYTVVTPNINSAGVVKFAVKTLGNGLTATPTVLSTGYLSSQVTGIDNVAYWSATSTDQVGFKLGPQGNNVPKTKLYAGIWYQLALAVSGASVKEAFFGPAVVTSGWSGEPVLYTDPTVATLMDVAFIPRSAVGSLYTAGVCTSVANEWDLFGRFDAWVRHAYMAGPATFEQTNCTGPLGATSANCAFIGTGCNGSAGYTYCTSYQTCADGCFGICYNGETCIYDPILAKWYCPPDCAVNPPCSSSSSDCSSSSSDCDKLSSSWCGKSSSSWCGKSSSSWWNSTWFLLILLLIFVVILFFSGRYFMR